MSGSPESPPDAAGAHSEWDAAVATFLEDASKAPDFGIEEQDLVRFAQERMPRDVPGPEALRKLHAADLKLVLACIEGRPRAVAELDATLRRSATQALRRIHPSYALIDDVVQQVMEHLVTSKRLEAYRGTGRLSAWLRVIAYRTGLRELERYAPEIPCDSEPLFERLLPTDDPELQSMKAAVKQSFRAAFAEAVEGLSHFDRELLRDHVLGEKSVADLASIHNAHRATLARWVARIRERLLAETLERMARDLGVDRGDLSEVMELFDSRLSASVERLLG